jgi:hypothetical protein
MINGMADADRYLCVARLDGIERIFLWEGEDPGPARVVVDQQGFVVSFASVSEAREATASERWNVSAEEVTVYDFDAIETWCRSDSGIQNCSPLLNAWNLFVDLPHGENLFRAADSRALSLYDKLLRGCNLPSMTPPGEHYEPTWTAVETAALKHLLLLGLADFRARFR